MNNLFSFFFSFASAYTGITALKNLLLLFSCGYIPSDMVWDHKKQSKQNSRNIIMVLSTKPLDGRKSTLPFSFPNSIIHWLQLGNYFLIPF